MQFGLQQGAIKPSRHLPTIHEANHHGRAEPAGHHHDAPHRAGE
tara:strand:- start:1855 stop:1986 length:132 start_codon:yes stop_codon:yes gene_type:complete